MPIAESVGALSELVDAGKIGAIGLSEVSVARLREAQAVATITAVQNEYSLWSRNPELGILEATRETGVALVAFSPVARGFLADALHDPDALAPKDLRRALPRFRPDHWQANLALLPAVASPRRRGRVHAGAARTRVAAVARRPRRSDPRDDEHRPSAREFRGGRTGPRPRRARSSGRTDRHAPPFPGRDTTQIQSREVDAEAFEDAA